jgi:2-polyprenyl-3-methyl-5-hydroxy-6-metoxy-1,4-benzoquinol methylase
MDQSDRHSIDQAADIVLQTAFWNSWNATHRESRQPGVQIVQRAVRIIEVLRRLGVRDARLLEAGCGTGWMSDRLTEFGSVTGCDLAEDVIARARTHYPSVTFLAGDILSIDLEHEYDVVTCMEVLSHVYDQAAFVRRMRECLLPGGHLLLTTQNRFVYERRSDVVAREPGQVRRWLHRSELRALLRPHFEIVEMRTWVPAGDRGILRVINSSLLQSVVDRFGMRKVWCAMRERWGLGESIFVHARAVGS